MTTRLLFPTINYMEVIPPSSLQSQQQNQNIEPETTDQPEVQTSTVWKIFDFIRSSVFEVVLIGLFSVIILTTLNYFNIIPLSSIFPALSFLPQQNSIQGSISNNNSTDDITFFNNNMKFNVIIYPLLKIF